MNRVLAAVAAALSVVSIASVTFAEEPITPAADTPAPTQAQPLPDPPPVTDDKPVSGDTYSPEEITRAANDFFGATTEGLARVIEKVFAEQGRPNAYITGNEGSGAIVVGLRYGRGELNYKGGGSMPVFWQGPSVGWDFGGNGSKVFTLVYKLRSTNQLFQRFPGVDGSLYLVAGFGMNYQRSGDVTLAPIRTGVGLRAGANVGYLHYTVKQSWIPF